jgi:hypothetical protein
VISLENIFDGLKTVKGIGVCLNILGENRDGCRDVIFTGKYAF